VDDEKCPTHVFPNPVVVSDTIVVETQHLLPYQCQGQHLMRNYGQWIGGTTRKRTEVKGRDFAPLKRQIGGTGSCRKLGQRDVPTVKIRTERMGNGKQKKIG
jgi:hypothetical protein